MSNKYKCINGPIYVRKIPNDNGQVCSLVRKGTIIEADALLPGLIYHNDGSKATVAPNVWVRFEKGYVRFVSLLGTKNYFEKYTGVEDYPQADSTLRKGDSVMMRVGTTDVYNRTLEPEAYAPNVHIVHLLDSSKTLALLGYPNGINAWVPVENLVVVSRYNPDGIYYTNNLLGN